MSDHPLIPDEVLVGDRIYVTATKDILFVTDIYQYPLAYITDSSAYDPSEVMRLQRISEELPNGSIIRMIRFDGHLTGTYVIGDKGISGKPYNGLELARVIVRIGTSYYPSND